MPTTPTSMVNRLMGVEAFTDGLKGTSIAIGAGGSEVTVAASPAEITRNCQASSRIVTAITTLAVTQALHDGRVILLSLLAGFTSTLPAATGTGSIYYFMVGIINTSAAYVFVTTGSDVFNGGYFNAIGGNTGGKYFASTVNKTLTWDGNGNNKGGGAIGDWVEFIDIATGIYAVSGSTVASGGVPVTGFSN